MPSRDSTSPGHVGWLSRPRRRSASILLAGFAAVSTPLAAAADAVLSTEQMKQLTLEDLMQVEVPTVYGASKREQKVSEAPALVNIVTQDEIKQQGLRTLADILRSVPGFYVTYDRSYGYIGLRGVNRPGDYGGRVLLNLDGHRLNDPIFDQAPVAGDFPLDVDLIERVEIIRGPGSSLYGNNALFTVINVVTRQGRDVKGVEAAGSVASYDTYTGRLTYGNRFTNGLEMMFSGSVLSSAGHDALHYAEFNDVNGGVAEKLDNEYAGKFFASLRYKDFSLVGAYSERTKEIPTAAYGTVFNTPPSFTEDARGLVELKYEYEFPKEWLLKARLYYDYYRYSAQGAFDAGDPLDPGAVVVNEDVAQTQFWGAEVQVNKLLWEKHRLTLGADFRDAPQLYQQNYDLNPPTNYVNVRSDANNFGFFAQDEFSLRTNLILNLGIRYDHYNTFGGTVNPRAAVIWSPWTQTTWKAIYGQAFRAPNAYELYYTAPGYLSNPNLDAETVRSYELVWEQGLNRHLRLTTSLFYNQAEHLITQVEETAGWIYRNTDSVDARGVEMELAGRWEWFRGQVSYTYANAVDNATDARLSNSPEHMAKLNLSVPLYHEKVFASLQVQAMSRRQTVQGTETDPFALVNLTLFSRDLVKGLELSASVYNLFNTRYGDPVSVDFTQASIEQDGRTFRVKLMYRF